MTVRTRLAHRRKGGRQVNLDELPGKAELSHAQQGAGGGERGGQRRGCQLRPRVPQYGHLIADHVNDRPDDIVRPCAGRGQGNHGVRHDLSYLRRKIPVPDHGAVGADRALACQVSGTAGFHDSDIVIAGRQVQLSRIDPGDLRCHTVNVSGRAAGSGTRPRMSVGGGSMYAWEQIRR